VLKTAHLVYYKFWGKTLDDILQPVGPDCGNLKYLSQNQIGPLNLRALLYTPNVLLVRDEYELVYKDLCKYKDDKSIKRGGVVVTGQPGIGMLLSPTLVSITIANLTLNPGKTCFLYYLLFRLLSEKKSVAFQVDKIFVFFEDTGVSISKDAFAPGQQVTGRTGHLPILTPILRSRVAPFGGRYLGGSNYPPVNGKLAIVAQGAEGRSVLDGCVLFR
jgi:hypothetical protein